MADFLFYKKTDLRIQPSYYLIAASNGQLHVMKYLEKKHNWDIKSIFYSDYSVNENNNMETDAYLVACRDGQIHIINYLENTHNWDPVKRYCKDNENFHDPLLIAKSGGKKKKIVWCSRSRADTALAATHGE